MSKLAQKEIPIKLSDFVMYGYINADYPRDMDHMMYYSSLEDIEQEEEDFERGTVLVFHAVSANKVTSITEYKLTSVL